MVVLYHFHLIVMPLHNPVDYALMSKWYLMVDLFFVLSGFILCHVYGHLFRDNFGWAGFRSYIWARFARIYPLHLFTLLCAVGLYLVIVHHQLPLMEIEHRVFDVRALPTSLLLIDAWGMHLEATWNTPSWSISVEWFLYLIFPILITFLYRRGKAGRLQLAVVAWLGLVLLVYLLQPMHFALRQPYLTEFASGWLENSQSVNAITGVALVRGFGGFVLGMFAYQFYQRKDLPPWLGKGLLWWMIWAATLALWTKALLPDLIALPLFALLILNTAMLQGRTARLLNTRLLRFLGDISYSIYLVHILILFSWMIWMKLHPQPTGDLPDYLTRWIMVGIFLGASILVATLTYFGIERPMRKWLRARQPQKVNQVQVQKSTL